MSLKLTYHGTNDSVNATPAVLLTGDPGTDQQTLTAAGYLGGVIVGLISKQVYEVLAFAGAIGPSAPEHVRPVTYNSATGYKLIAGRTYRMMPTPASTSWSRALTMCFSRRLILTATRWRPASPPSRHLSVRGSNGGQRFKTRSLFRRPFHA
jgi:hypothetical protein